MTGSTAPVPHKVYSQNVSRRQTRLSGGQVRERVEIGLGISDRHGVGLAPAAARGERGYFGARGRIDAEVQVRSRRVAGVAGVTYQFSGANRLSAGNGNSREVRIQSREPVVVLDKRPLAV